MKDFVVKKISNTNITTELEKIGFDSSYVNAASDKYKYLNLKIYELTLPQANILKQTALSFGCDCAIHKDVLTSRIESTDCILTGSISQLKKIAESLNNQQFSLPNLGLQIKLSIQEKTYENTKLVGILNLTENSFSDGGNYLNFENAIEHLKTLIEDGADIIDIGAESTKPFSTPVSDEIQLERILPVLEYIKSNHIDIPISIDTRSSLVAKKCIEKGVQIINDVSGFEYDANMINVLNNSDAKIIIQHSKGTPETMQVSPEYTSVIDEIFLNLKEKIDFANKNNIPNNRIIADVGIGFGKKQEHNFELLKRIEEFQTLGCDLMVGHSRKSFLDLDTNEDKDIYTTAISALLIEKKVNYLRVHNVKMHKKLIKIMKNFGG